jgi:microcystin-dependent protein
MSEAYVGEIRMFAGNYAPYDWALCDGRTLRIADYQTLFSVIGTTYGGDGYSTFALPDLRGRAPVHQGQGPGLSSRTLGQGGGVEQVTVSDAQMAAHNHSLAVAEGPGDSINPAGNVWAQSDALIYADASDGTTMAPGSLSNSTAGEYQPHDNMMPFLCMNFIIALEGIYPSRP